MPTYDYKCTECGHHFEMLQSISAKPIDKCPQCKGKVKRMIGSGAGVIFKGSGFYATDYKKSKPSGGCDSGSSGCKGCPKSSHNH